MSDEGIANVRSSLAKLKKENTGLSHIENASARDGTLAKMSREDLLQNQVEYLHNEISRKEEDLKLSAEIGQQLLSKVEDGVAEIEDLQERLKEEERQREKAFEGKTVAEKKVVRMRIAIEDLELEREELEKEMSTLKNELMQAKVKAKDGSETDTASVELMTQLDKLKEENEKLSKEAQKHHKWLRERKEESDDLNEQVVSLSARISELEKLEKELEELKKTSLSVRSLKEKCEELDWENRELNLALREMSVEYEHLKADSFLEQLQNELDELKNFVEELHNRGVIPADLLSQLPSSPQSVPATPEHPSPSPALMLKSPSLADELQGIDEEDGVARDDGVQRNLNSEFTPSSSTSSFATDTSDIQSEESKRRTPGGGLRRRPWELASDHPLDGEVNEEEEEEDPTKHYDDKAKEFFFLTALSIKINQGDRLEDVQTISTKQLYRKAAIQKVPFHKFHVWLSREIVHAYIGRIYEKDQDVASNERSQSQEKLSFWDRIRGKGKKKKGERAVAKSQSMGGMYQRGKEIGKAMSGGRYQVRTVKSRRSRLSQDDLRE